MEKTEKDYINIVYALGDEYIGNYYCNAKDNTYEAVRNRKPPLVCIPPKGKYSENFAQYVKQRVVREDQGILTEKLSLSYIKDHLTETNRKIVIEYRGTSLGEKRWYRILAIFVDTDEEGELEHFIVAFQDIDQERKEFSQQLLERNEALQTAYDAANHANQAKSDFLSQMSHDIRTPMNAIMGMTAIAGTHLDDKERVQDCLGKITVSSKHLLSLINEVLDMSRIESGKMALTEEAFNLKDLIDNLLDMVKVPVQEKRHKIQVNMHNIEHEQVIGDSLRIQQVFVNIMSNAVKYTPAEGRISLDISEKKSSRANVGCYEFVFEDNGIGMKPEFIEHIFEPFVRAEDTRVNKIQGTGLGMSIARSVVQMMDGDIKVESEPGKGSRFTVNIYLKLQNPDEVSGKKEEENTLEIFQNHEFLGKRVLLVEDNELNREIAAEILAATGLAVETAEDGREAVDMVAASKEDYYQMIFMDIQMPSMNGYEAATAIRSLNREDLNRVPIIAMTANAFAEDVEHARNCGMNEHVAKPLDFGRLMQTMERWMSVKK